MEVTHLVNKFQITVAYKEKAWPFEKYKKLKKRLENSDYRSVEKKDLNLIKYSINIQKTKNNNLIKKIT